MLPNKGKKLSERDTVEDDSGRVWLNKKEVKQTKKYIQLQ